MYVRLLTIYGDYDHLAIGMKNERESFVTMVTRKGSYRSYDEGSSIQTEYVIICDDQMM